MEVIKKRKHEKYSLERKLEIIISIENGKKLSQVAEELKIPKSTLGTWLAKQKDTIRDSVSRGNKKASRTFFYYFFLFFCFFCSYVFYLHPMFYFFSFPSIIII